MGAEFTRRIRLGTAILKVFRIIDFIYTEHVIYNFVFI